MTYHLDDELESLAQTMFTQQNLDPTHGGWLFLTTEERDTWRRRAIARHTTTAPRATRRDALAPGGTFRRLIDTMPDTKAAAQ